MYIWMYVSLYLYINLGSHISITYTWIPYNDYTVYGKQQKLGAIY